MRRRRRSLERKFVLVALKSGASLRGVLWSHAGDLYVLRHAEYLEPHREPVILDGSLVVDLDNVEFVQVLPGPVPTPAAPIRAVAG